MPKKHAHSFNSNNSSSYVHPSLSTLGSSQRDPPKDTSSSVTDRLNHLRLVQAPKASSEQKKEIADATAPPIPKPGSRVTRSVRTSRPARRAPAGPAAPRSWLEGSASKDEASASMMASIHSPQHLKDTRRKVESMAQDHVVRTRPNLEPRSCCDGVREASHTAGGSSLVHQVLKTMAVNWDFIVEYEQHNLATLPIPLKESLISHLTFYGPDEGVDIHSLKTLFLSAEELPNATGCRDITRLNLSSLVGWGFSLSQLTKYCTITRDTGLRKKSRLASNKEDIEISGRNTGLEPSDTDASLLSGKFQAVSTAHTNSVAESWEDELEEVASPLQSIRSTFRLPNLTHLYLANPGPSASWADLLSISTHLSTLTHLSLAHWPIPTLTPNSSTTSVISKHSPAVHAGGRHFYSVTDEDWHEAATILRRLSKNTYCLKWLDVEGIAWYKALGGTALRSAPWEREPFDEWDALGSSLGYKGPDFDGSWSQVTYVNLSQGWVPEWVQSVRRIPMDMRYDDIQKDLQSYLRKLHPDQASMPEIPVDPSNRPGPNGPTVEWFQKEFAARDVAETIRLSRAALGGLRCTFDHGWTQGRGTPRRFQTPDIIPPPH
ncbi:Lyso-phosphatidylcholine acyltransferase [Cryomyces antarcticus]|nr:Lyso-phosphatidylcholine acyltransferase [Cryomyces antarcticus]KAK5020035.1 Lyso-phosphatidylcholine acyltransferase [Cryomyces antarcticus]